MPKNKPCKGLLKRIRFTKSGKVKFRRTFGRHLRSGKSRKLKRSYRRPVYAKACDVKRVRALLFTSVSSGGRRTDPAADPATDAAEAATPVT